jgi:hypothetical protein
MKRHYAEVLLASGFLVWTGLGISDAAPTDPRLDLVAGLQAMGPHPSLGEQAQVFGRFVSAARKERYIGTTLRYFEPKSGAWSVTFIDPENGSVATLTGGAAEGGRIVLHSQNKDGRETRWSFDEIRPDSWVFRDEETSDSGKTWRLREEDRMKRRDAAHVRCDHPCTARWLAWAGATFPR